MTENSQALEAVLRDLIPGAELHVQPIDSGSSLRLLLLRDTQAGRGLTGDAAARVMNDPLYWIFCWASGRVLAKYILSNPHLVAGKRILDFGCGSGVVAIAAAMAGAEEVIACDIDPLALEATAFNAQLNSVSLTLCSDFEQVHGAIDLILVADVLYDRANLSWLSRFMERADEVWVADSRVRDFCEPNFERIGQFDSTTLPDLDESREFNRVSLYRGLREQP